MNLVDILLVLVILLALVAGWRRGFIAGLLGLTSWAGSITLAYLFYPHTASVLDLYFNMGPWLLPVAFLLTGTLAWVCIFIIARQVSRLIPESVHRHVLNRFTGVIPGAVMGLLFAVMISSLLLALPLSEGITRETRESRWGQPLAMQAEWVNRKLAPVFDEAIRVSMNSMTVKPRSDEHVSLAFTHDDPDARPDLEAEMLELLNKERAKEGLPPLKADPEMTLVARAHSKDMFARGYFAHKNPDGQSPFDRMDLAGVKYKAAGENLALAQTMEIAHRNLMNSPGHRANIMSDAFGRVGIGILDGGFYGLMISQEFRD